MANTNNNMVTPSIPMTYSRLAARTLGLSEKNLDNLLMGTGVTNKELLRDDTLLNGRQQVQILSNALDISNDPAFGLYFGQQVTPPTHGPLGFLVNSSPTLLDAIDAFRSYLPLRMNITRIDVSTNDTWLECRLSVNPGVTSKVHRLFLETLSLSLLSITEFILGRPLREGVLSFAFAAPSYQALYRSMIPCKVEFDAAENILRIPIGLAKVPNISSDHNNYEYSLNQCRQLLKELNTDYHATHTQVRRLLLSNPNHQMLESDVAAALFVSKRTLARRLREEDTSFRNVREEVLTSLAESYLLNTTLSLDAIAGLLSYHDSSNFRRAFKRWKKMTPEQFRKHKRDNQEKHRQEDHRDAPEDSE
jgi:AraC-like DNA-binding protein